MLKELMKQEKEYKINLNKKKEGMLRWEDKIIRVYLMNNARQGVSATNFPSNTLRGVIVKKSTKTTANDKIYHTNERIESDEACTKI
ncbi:hypothetical protein PGB90_000755 [Kerria lacca]